MIAETLARVEGLLSIVRRTGAVNVNSQETKQRALDLSRAYFSETRPFIVANVGESETLLAHDDTWQHLVRLAHANNAKRTYVRVLVALRKQMAELNVAALSSVASRQSPPGVQNSREEILLMDTLERLIPSAATSYRQGLLDLRAADRLSYRGTAAEFREALREVLDHLAPDGEVQKQPGFKLESGQTKPTMKQKVRFVLTSRGHNRTQRESAEDGAVLVEELSGRVARAVYNRASLATHVQESRREVQQIKRYVDTILFDLLEVTTAGNER